MELPQDYTTDDADCHKVLVPEYCWKKQEVLEQHEKWQSEPRYVVGHGETEQNIEEVQAAEEVQLEEEFQNWTSEKRWLMHVMQEQCA